MSMREIRVTCDPENRLRRIPLDELHPIQGELKEVLVEDYEKFKALIIKEGLDDAFDVWRELTPVHSKSEAKRVAAQKKSSQEGATVIKWWILDGHLRKLMLTKMRDEEGYKIPDIPCKETEAVSIKHAKRKVLSKSAIFHKMRRDGLYKFMYDIEMSMAELKGYSLPHIELPKFEAEFFKEPLAVTNPLEEKSAEEHWEDLPEFNGPDARIRMVLTFPSDAERHKFLDFLKLDVADIRNPNAKCWSLLWPPVPK